jgi:hypothetical protein
MLILHIFIDPSSKQNKKTPFKKIAATAARAAFVVAFFLFLFHKGHLRQNQQTFNFSRSIENQTGNLFILFSP